MQADDVESEDSCHEEEESTAEGSNIAADAAAAANT